MDGVEKVLDLKPVAKVKKKEPIIINKVDIDEVTFHDLHNEDVRDDYKDSRKSLKKAIGQAGNMADRILDSLDVEPDTKGEDADQIVDRMLSRKAEAFAKIIKCISDLNKDLMDIHGKYINLSDGDDDEEDDEDEEKGSSNKKSSSDIKSGMKRNRKLFEAE